MIDVDFYLQNKERRFVMKKISISFSFIFVFGVMAASTAEASFWDQFLGGIQQVTKVVAPIAQGAMGAL